MMFEAQELIAVRLSRDGKHLRLRLRDQSGAIVSLSLPADCLNSLLGAVPRQFEGGAVHALDSWTLDRTPNGDTLVLTLRTPEGQAVSFAAMPWQLAGMATIATYGRADPAADETLH